MTERLRRFVDDLERLDNQSRSRLRRLLVDRADGPIELAQWLADASPEEREAMTTVAGLYPLHPDNTVTDPAHNMGWTARTLLSRVSPTGDPHGIVKRFRNILDAGDHESLAYDLGWFVRMAAQHDVGVNWRELLVDLAQFFAPDRSVQRRWAGAFFAKSQ